MKTICVIDDEEELREAMQIWLEDQGYGVFCTGNPLEAFDLVRKNKPHLVLLDITMPGMDGLEVLRVLKSSPETRSIPVVMLTGMKESEAIETARKLGADSYFYKPFEVTAFLAAIDEAIKHSI